MSDSIETASVWSSAWRNAGRGSNRFPLGRAWWVVWILAALTIPALAGVANAHGSPAAGTYPRFELGARETSPFPSNLWTVRDHDQITGLRVSLVKPDCSVRPSDCQDIDILNTLDGFNLLPRLAIPFNGAIDPTSVSSDTVFLLALNDDDDDRGRDRDRSGSRDDRERAMRIGINQVVWDPATSTLFVEADPLLEEATRYALIVTTGVRDPSGNPVGKSPEFAAFLRGKADHDDDDDERQSGDRRTRHYREAIQDALDAARDAGVPKKKVAVATVFTTQSTTGAMSRIRDYVRSLPAPVADFGLGPGGARTVYSLSGINSIAAIRHTGVSPDSFTTVNVNFNAFAFVPGAVGSIAYGRLSAPNFLRPDVTFNVVGTEDGVPPVTGMQDLYFNLLLPSGPEPEDGWPVAMLGVGGDREKEVFPTLLAPTLAKYGIASMVINPVGRGFGPNSTNRVTLVDGSSTTFLAGGRGRDVDGNKVIGSQEGGLALKPYELISRAHAMKQTTIDHLVLVRAVQLGIDVDGDGAPDLDADRMYYFGWSLGTSFGGPLVAIEPAFRASVQNAMGGPQIHLQRLGGQRDIVGRTLASRTPSLINVGGIVFNENIPLRDQPPLVNTVAGAIAIQEYMEWSEWAMQNGEAIAYAKHLRTVLQSGEDDDDDDDDEDDDDEDDDDDDEDDVRVRGVLIQMAKGDMTQPNPSASAVIRAGGLEAYTTYYRHDLACAANPCTTAARKNPHAFPIQGVLADAYFAAVTRGAQEQAAQFLASDGLVVIHPTPTNLFEVPIVLPLPEVVNFIP